MTSTHPLTALSGEKIIIRPTQLHLPFRRTTDADTNRAYVNDTQPLSNEADTRRGSNSAPLHTTVAPVDAPMSMTVFTPKSHPCVATSLTPYKQQPPPPPKAAEQPRVGRRDPQQPLSPPQRVSSPPYPNINALVPSSAGRHGGSAPPTPPCAMKTGIPSGCTGRHHSSGTSLPPPAHTGPTLIHSEQPGKGNQTGAVSRNLPRHKTPPPLPPKALERTEAVLFPAPFWEREQQKGPDGTPAYVKDSSADSYCDKEVRLHNTMQRLGSHGLSTEVNVLRGVHVAPPPCWAQGAAAAAH